VGCVALVRLGHVATVCLSAIVSIPIAVAVVNLFHLDDRDLVGTDIQIISSRAIADLFFLGTR
jgi:hypothetical protein